MTSQHQRTPEQELIRLVDRLKLRRAASTLGVSSSALGRQVKHARAGRPISARTREMVEVRMHQARARGLDFLDPALDGAQGIEPTPRAQRDQAEEQLEGDAREFSGSEIPEAHDGDARQNSGSPVQVSSEDAGAPDPDVESGLDTSDALLGLLRGANVDPQAAAAALRQLTGEASDPGPVEAESGAPSGEPVDGSGDDWSEDWGSGYEEPPDRLVAEEPDDGYSSGASYEAPAPAPDTGFFSDRRAQRQAAAARAREEARVRAQAQAQERAAAAQPRPAPSSEEDAESAQEAAGRDAEPGPFDAPVSDAPMEPEYDQANYEYDHGPYDHGQQADPGPAVAEQAAPVASEGPDPGSALAPVVEDEPGIRTVTREQVAEAQRLLSEIDAIAPPGAVAEWRRLLAHIDEILPADEAEMWRDGLRQLDMSHDPPRMPVYGGTGAPHDAEVMYWRHARSQEHTTVAPWVAYVDEREVFGPEVADMLAEWRFIQHMLTAARNGDYDFTATDPRYSWSFVLLQAEARGKALEAALSGEHQITLPPAHAPMSPDMLQHQRDSAMSAVTEIAAEVKRAAGAERKIQRLLGWLLRRLGRR